MQIVKLEAVEYLLAEEKVTIVEEGKQTWDIEGALWRMVNPPFPDNASIGQVTIHNEGGKRRGIEAVINGKPTRCKRLTLNIRPHDVTEAVIEF